MEGTFRMSAAPKSGQKPVYIDWSRVDISTPAVATDEIARCEWLLWARPEWTGSSGDVWLVCLYANRLEAGRVTVMHLEVSSPDFVAHLADAYGSAPEGCRATVDGSELCAAIIAADEEGSLGITTDGDLLTVTL